MPDPSLTCAQLAAAQGYLAQQREEPAPDRSGSVLVDVRWQPAAGATRATGCDGPIDSIRVRNNSGRTAWVLLPNKKSGQLWMKGDPGTDVTTSNKGTLANLGLSNAADAFGAQIVWTQPA